MNKNIEYKKLGEICNFIAGGTPLKSKIEYWKDGSIPWIKISDLKEKYVKFSDEKITKEGLEKSSAKILEKGTILYTIFASVGKVAILDIEATTNQAIVGINLKKDIFVDKNFLYYFLCSIENNIKNQARGVAQNNINISILKNINIPIFPIVPTAVINKSSFNGIPVIFFSSSYLLTDIYISGIIFLELESSTISLLLKKGIPSFLYSFSKTLLLERI